MDQNISFSFVMPAYKIRFLNKAIDSILRQRYTDFELIIINDASPDDLGGIIEQFSDKRIKYHVSEKNLGGKDLIAFWNHCLKYARNEYIILATDDDTFEEEFLSDAVKLIKKYPEVNVLRSGVKKIDENEKVLDIEFPAKEYMNEREFMLYYAKGCTISCVSNYIFKRSALEETGGFKVFPRGHYSDDATVLANLQNGIACIPYNRMHFRVSSINLSNQCNIHIVLDQIKATKMFMDFFMERVEILNHDPSDFFKTACYGGYKSKYMTMVTQLLSKIPLTKIHLVAKTIWCNTQLFKKDKLRLTANYFISKT